MFEFSLWPKADRVVDAQLAAQESLVLDEDLSFHELMLMNMLLEERQEACSVYIL